MKKFFVALLICGAFALNANAQSSAIGLRGGYGCELSYQRMLSPSSRAEFDLGLFYADFNVAGMYQWVWGLDNVIAEGFAWYAGVGADLLIGNNLRIGALGQIGLEYNFIDIPLQISLDYRPTIFFDEDGFEGRGVALGVRYRF